uniref:Oxidative stress-induced growth inhibitor 1 n=1 Tax=Callorhinchus milii TaxID=7868 RepID=V9KMQ9_CALMI
MAECEKTMTLGHSAPKSTQGGSPLSVVVIGNGPSGICLSYLLSGYRPYFKESAIHPNPILQWKLQKNAGVAITQQDLEFLSEGLEGRSHNPVAVLFDSLLRPEADFGMSMDSVLSWRLEPDQHIPHLVLGKGPPGGAWHSIKGSMITLSLGDWMELPDLRIRDWMREKRRCVRNDRTTTADIALYYQHYVKDKGLQRNIACGTVVTSVRKVSPASHCEGEGGIADTHLPRNQAAEPQPCSTKPTTNLFEIKGHIQSTTGLEKTFCIYAENVVLATGTYDSPAQLGIEGEDLPFVSHTISELEEAIKQQRVRQNFDPILIVGAGLTAADAVLSAHHSNIPILHVFRRRVNDPGLIFNQLPKMMYPEYHKVHQMMQEQSFSASGPYDGYISLPQYQVLSFKADNKCILQNIQSGERKIFNISMALILIGSNPNLSFLPEHGSSLGVNVELPINCRRNPIDIDMYTYESVQEPGLYAVGPLVGDHFVRFLQGGALAVSSALIKRKHDVADKHPDHNHSKVCQGDLTQSNVASKTVLQGGVS